MQRLDNQPPGEGDYLKALVYGNTGTGKTTVGVTCPSPLIVLSEAQGMRSIRSAAARTGVPMPQVVLVETEQDIYDVSKGLAGPRDRPMVIQGEEYEWPHTVVLDSMTDIVEGIFLDAVAKSLPKDDHGEAADSRKMYGLLGKRIGNMLRFYRDLPMHVLFLCQAYDELVGDGNDSKRVIKPQLPGKLSKKICQATNLVGYSRRAYTGMGDDAQREIGWTVMTAGPDYMELKTCRPLRDKEEPDFSDWCMRLAADVAPAAQEGDYGAAGTVESVSCAAGGILNTGSSSSASTVSTVLEDDAEIVIGSGPLS